ncbi:hypothetical protein DFH11DRAFT_1460571, partial [Phellopilus nigrolimitatus]
WNDQALASQFYAGLTDSIKKAISTYPTSRPKTLDRLKSLALKIDNRVAEYEREQRLGGRSSYNPPQQSVSRKPFGTQPNQSYSKNPPHRSVGQNSGNFKKPQPQLAKFLNSDGTLKEEEKERRRAAGRCLYCNSPDHKLETCP